MKNFNNLFYGAIIVLIIGFNIWIRSGYKDSIRDWAKLNNCTIHNMEYMWFERGAFSVFSGGKGVTFYKVDTSCGEYWFKFHAFRSSYWDVKKN